MKRILLVFATLLVFPSVVLSQAQYTKVQGYAEQGGKVITVAPTVSHKVQASYPSCTITVYLTGTVTLANIYSNNAGLVKANPFTADSTGYYSFFVRPGVYDIKFSGTGITTPFTLAGIDVKSSIITPAEYGVICDDSTDNTSAFADMITDIGAANITITIDGICRTGNVTFPSNIAFSFINSGGLRPTNATIITINGPISEFPVSKRFYNALSGQGTISFTSNRTISRLYPQYWGGAGDNSVDNDGAFAATIAALVTRGGGTMELVPGAYRTSGISIETDSITIKGHGSEVSVLVMTSATGNTISIGASGQRRYNNILGVGFVPAVSRTAGAEIIASNFISLTIDDVRFDSPFNAIILGSAGNQSFNPIVSNIKPFAGIEKGSKNVFLSLYRVLDGHYNNISFIALANTKGILIEGGCEGNQFENVHAATGDVVTVQTTGYGLLMENTLGGGVLTPSYNKFTNCLFDAFYIGMYIAAGSQNHFVNCWTSSQGPTGIRHGVTGGGVNSATGTSFVGGQSYNGMNNGVQLFGPGTITFNGFHVIASNRNNNLVGSSLSAGFYLDMDSGGHAALNGCYIANDAQRYPANQQQHGIWITNRAGQTFNISNNVIYPNTTSGINNLLGVGGGRIIRDNFGYRTESSDVGSIASGSTSVVITHLLTNNTLGITPAPSDIIITPSGNTTNTIKLPWVSNITSTSFTVNVNTDPGASGFNFGWQVRKQ